jgi:T-complex protein 1 subunit beta
MMVPLSSSQCARGQCGRKVLVDINKVQDDVVGDGTTTVAVLCGELLREAEQLVNQRIHPQTICAGWRLAQQVARKALEDSASKAASEEAFRAELIEIAETTLSSKLVTYDKSTLRLWRLKQS